MKDEFKDIKMIVSDLDHTILMDEFNLEDVYPDTFRKLREKGYTLVVASARGFYQSYIFSQYLIPDYTICDNGASIVKFDYEKRKKNIVYEKRIPEDVKLDILNNLIGYDTLISVIESGDVIYITRNSYSPEVVRDYSQSYLKAKKTVPQFDVRVVDTIEDVPFDLPLTRIAVFDHVQEKDTHRHLEELGRKHPEIRYSRSFSTTFEYGCSDKGETLKRLMDITGMKKENVLCFGDGATDIAMFRHAGISVAVKNASEEVRNSATLVCDSVFDLGVYRFITENLLNE